MRREINRHLRARYPMLLHEVTEAGRTIYLAEFPDLPGCMSHGKSPNEALKNAEGAKRLWIRSRLEDRQPIPPPTEVVEFSGKFVLRTPKALHRELVNQAAQNGVSLNHYAVARLGEATAVDRIRRDLQQEFLQLKGEVEELRKQNQHLAMLLSRSLMFRRLLYEETLVVQGQPDVSNPRVIEPNAPALRGEMVSASTAVTSGPLLALPQTRR